MASLLYKANPPPMTAVLRAAMRLALVNNLRAKHKQDIADDQHKGAEVKAVKWLRRSVPFENRDRDELFSQVRYFAIEAVEIFDPFRGAKFSTFLIGHLRLRCQSFQQYTWTRRSRATLDSEPHSSALMVRSESDILAQLKEFREALSPDSQVVFDLLSLATTQDEPTITSAAESNHYRAKLSRMTGLPKERIESFRREVRAKLPNYL